MIEIDGSMGEGGGQILRSALGLSLVTGLPFRIDGIRAGRKKPGLLRQHLTCVQVAERIGVAEVEGAQLGSTTMTFRPQAVMTGEFHCAIGTAGSTSLVLQAVLPAMLVAEAPIRLVVEGGTHNPWAPPFDFLQESFLPLLGKMGADVQVEIERPGFFPAGGGRIVADVEPKSGALRPLQLEERGVLRRKRAIAYVSGLDPEIGLRELKVVRRKLHFTMPELELVEDKRALGPGNILTLIYEFDHVTEVFTGFGERGRRAEQVADLAIKEAKNFLAAEVPVGPHLADQLLLPLAMAGGGSFCAMPLTQHSLTNIQVVQRFLPVLIRHEQEGRVARVQIEGA